MHPCFRRRRLPREIDHSHRAGEIVGQVLRDAIRTDPTHDRFGRLGQVRLWIFQAATRVASRLIASCLAPFRAARRSSVQFDRLIAVSRIVFAAETRALAELALSCMTARKVSTASAVARCICTMACWTTARRLAVGGLEAILLEPTAEGDFGQLTMRGSLGNRRPGHQRRNGLVLFAAEFFAMSGHLRSPAVIRLSTWSGQGLSCLVSSVFGSG